LNFLIRFAAKLDPNGDSTSILWPQYAVESQDMPMMIGEWPWSPPTIVQNTYRKEGGDRVLDEFYSCSSAVVRI
jgi:hypothetical protein